MNYDPIHDTYTESPKALSEGAAQPSNLFESMAGGAGAAEDAGFAVAPGNGPGAASGSPGETRAKPETRAKADPRAKGETRAKPETAAETRPKHEPDQAPRGLPSTFRSVSKGFKHLKKADGEPFWRKDIQHDFLDELFGDQHRVFTNYFPPCEVPNAANDAKLTFGELYVRTLAESSKSSKVLRERLIKDPQMGIAVSKVCFLVNAGRMNTTVNFVPDMRSALRTYHSIPSLQASPDGVSKPLQDTPRLKTILKAVCDNQSHLSTLLDMLRAPAAAKPNTNVIKLVFMMSTFFQNIPFHHEGSYNQDALLNKLKSIKASPGPQNKFMEFFLGDDIYPENRARRFLWLMYTYLETSFTSDELARNPFGPSTIPPLEFIPPQEQARFDVDPDYEIDYAVKMYQSRMMHLNEEVSNTNPKRGNKSKRERLKIRKQLMLDPSLRSEHDDDDDSMMADDTMNSDDDDDDDERPSFVQHYTDRSKRKKPTASVGSLVDDSRKFTNAGMKGLNPEFPLNLDAVRGRFARCTRTVHVPPLTKDSPVAVARRRGVVQRTGGFLAHFARVTPAFESQRRRSMAQLHRYFQYRKSCGRGLLGLEWEDIRSDVASGVETYLYQQLGKSVVNRIYDSHTEEERYNNGEPELLKREKFITRSDYLPGDLAPIDLGAVEPLGQGFVDLHDLDHANETKHYQASLLALVDDLVSQNHLMQASHSETMHFDLDAAAINYS